MSSHLRHEPTHELSFGCNPSGATYRRPLTIYSCTLLLNPVWFSSTHPSPWWHGFPRSVCSRFWLLAAAAVRTPPHRRRQPLHCPMQRSSPAQPLQHHRPRLPWAATLAAALTHPPAFRPKCCSASTLFVHRARSAVVLPTRRLAHCAGTQICCKLPKCTQATWRTTTISRTPGKMAARRISAFWPLATATPAWAKTLRPDRPASSRP